MKIFCSKNLHLFHFILEAVRFVRCLWSESPLMLLVASPIMYHLLPVCVQVLLVRLCSYIIPISTYKSVLFKKNNWLTLFIGMWQFFLCHEQNVGLFRADFVIFKSKDLLQSVSWKEALNIVNRYYAFFETIHIMVLKCWNYIKIARPYIKQDYLVINNGISIWIYFKNGPANLIFACIDSMWSVLYMKRRACSDLRRSRSW